MDLVAHLVALHYPLYANFALYSTYLQMVHKIDSGKELRVFLINFSPKEI